MNNRNDWNRLKDIKAPDELKARTLAGGASGAPRAQQQSAPQHLTAAPRRRFGMAKRIVAVACAFGVVVGGTAVWKAQRKRPASGRRGGGNRRALVRYCGVCCGNR